MTAARGATGVERGSRRWSVPCALVVASGLLAIAVAALLDYQNPVFVLGFASLCG